MKLDRMKELIEILNKASKAYYIDNEEIMSNFEYDKLYDELEGLEAENGIIFQNSPTQIVGFETISVLEKVRHDSRMLSLDKTKEISKLKSFLGENEGLLSWKLDGLTIVLKYENGNLSKAITRGNGEIGEDVTHNAKVFKNIPLKINFKENLILRGEAVISYSEFERINENIEENEKYKNPRNLCSGTVRQLNSEIVAKRNVCFFAFSLVSAGTKDFQNKKQNELEFLKELGFDVVEYKIVNAENIENIVYEFEAKIETNDFGSDGLVLTYDSISYSDSLGSTSKFPRDSIAFKWADEVRETKLIDIIWNTSRTGLINPIALFEPVELEGTTVNRASLHNLSILEALEIGIGDTLEVYKANMIIPQILENQTRSNNLKIPDNCPVCGNKTEIVKQKDTKVLLCSNPNCKAQQLSFLGHFTSRDAMNIEGLSEATLEKFIENNFISNYLDIFNINKFENEIQNLEGFGKRSYEKLIKAIEKSKNVDLPNFIYSLGISQVGLSNAKLLCSHFKYDIDKIVDAEKDELKSIEGYGEVISECIYNYFHQKENLELFYDALKILNINKPQEMENKLENLVFVITGDVSKFKNRKELQETIEKLGGKVTSSVTSKTNYLINNDINSNSSKNKKANELKIPIISEDEFISKFMNAEEHE